jgi:hypothetical protein
MSNPFRLLPIVLSAVLVVAAVPATAGAAGKAGALTVQSDQSRLGRGFGRSPGVGSRYRARPRPTYRRSRPSPLRGFFRGVLTALGISFLLHALFGWGVGGSPFGLLLLGAIVLWLVTRRRRRRVAYS